MQCASDIGTPPLLSASSSPSLNGLADTDSESAIFSSGLLVLFYLRSLVHTRFFLPRASPVRTEITRFPFLFPRAYLLLSLASSSPSHSQPDPDLRLRSGQHLNFGRQSVRASDNLFKMTIYSVILLMNFYLFYLF